MDGGPRNWDFGRDIVSRSCKALERRTTQRLNLDDLCNIVIQRCGCTNSLTLAVRYAARDINLKAVGSSNSPYPRYEVAASCKQCSDVVFHVKNSTEDTSSIF